ncbi:hypothetical protein GCM10011583_07530 [Streptomyces camponoticapitis]|uniref:Regulatory protein n=1 Tax=Streptomyces camponoticapitis TaxID=1616125 RepID=A0ABQ2DYJ3_9ACTN|nr:hypothetical protein [Streptomyces camponoticapitis]GGJ78488.1 hypothetical protein GCM10011583_07530 [Streptomyces camponoticapitis]
MSGTAVNEFTSVQSQYEAQVAADLERNASERKRLRGEIDSLQGQLERLERDHSLLLGVQRVFADGAGSDAARSPKVPGPRTAKRPAKASAGSGKVGKRAKAPAKAPAKARAKASGGAAAAEKQPSLARLVGTLLAAHGEPRSAAELAAELAADHPARNSNVNVVRNALEQLVAKSEAHRTKQQKSVFYSHAVRDHATAPAED